MALHAANLAALHEACRDVLACQSLPVTVRPFCADFPVSPLDRPLPVPAVKMAGLTANGTWETLQCGEKWAWGTTAMHAYFLRNADPSDSDSGHWYP